VVCIPMGRDQDDTAARVVHHGAGVRLSRTASTGTIRAAITKVLEYADYGIAAKDLAATITAECRSSTLVAEIESLVPTLELPVDGERS